MSILKFTLLLGFMFVASPMLQAQEVNPYASQVIGQRMGTVESVLGKGVFERPATVLGKRAITVYYTAPNKRHYYVTYAILNGGGAMATEEVPQGEFDSAYKTYKKEWGFK
ncbi:hypothetical protein [Mariprofundus ferrooxydans]|uniref:hypothetical protein n=1 Tax=Mariprofundus ferrooxydans TaxID=314344 RepID=UPI0014317765|nr:hypothetical protein [Mariprofundus ferrooxydans]